MITVEHVDGVAWRARLMDPVRQPAAVCKLAQFHVEHFCSPPGGPEPGPDHGYNDCRAIAESLALDGCGR